MSTDIKVKKWNPGVADEVWKIHICSRDVTSAEETIATLHYIVSPNYKFSTFEESIEDLKKFSTKQILDAVRKYRDASLLSINKGLNKETEGTING